MHAERKGKKILREKFLRHARMKSFGASGPADQLYRYFGITPEAVARAARDGLARM